MPDSMTPVCMTIRTCSMYFLVQPLASATMPWIRIVHVGHGVSDLLQKGKIFGMVVAENLVNPFECLRTQRSHPCAVQKPTTSSFGAIPARFSPQCQSRWRNRGRGQTQ